MSVMELAVSENDRKVTHKHYYNNYITEVFCQGTQACQAEK